jgi:hypothetical protein
MKLKVNVSKRDSASQPNAFDGFDLQTAIAGDPSRLTPSRMTILI